eukprot:CAMPEP_0171660364 /NCGR_PEP_ID=MMETSP0990-20121206/44230_1 /TAXON_ID=483369 /ORGANISM="non described non described, Strain CCMP2098" /LENGTH=33 /DNA_ID= /DNA_START= /DNA_END= /DNA_ORIENTATION=
MSESSAAGMALIAAGYTPGPPGSTSGRAAATTR